MRKRTWIVTLILVGALAVAIGTTPIFAHESAVPDSEAWEEMHQACENGDYENMAELHDRYHDGEDMMGGGMHGGSTMGGGMMGGW